MGVVESPLFVAFGAVGFFGMAFWIPLHRWHCGNYGSSVGCWRWILEIKNKKIGWVGAGMSFVVPISSSWLFVVLLLPLFLYFRCCLLIGRGSCCCCGVPFVYLPMGVWYLDELSLVGREAVALCWFCCWILYKSCWTVCHCHWTVW